MARRRWYIDAPLLRRAVNCRYNFGNCAVVCAAGHGEDHGDCSFSVVLIVNLYTERKVLAYAYSPAAATWGEVASGDALSSSLLIERPALLLGNVLYWTTAMDQGSQFRRNFTEISEISVLSGARQVYHIEQPLHAFDACGENVLVMEAEGGARAWAGHRVQLQASALGASG
ncbi:hypothetical protein ACP70R_019814 [Stipagrostis hirtigluma subsp. patula]